MANRALISACYLFLLLALVGCEGSGRIGIKGTVTYKGMPVDKGTIVFGPKDPTKATQEAAMIVGGSYEVPAAKGLMPGEYQVAIMAVEYKDGKPVTEQAPGAPRRGKDLIPEEYNVNSKLSIEVSAGGKREFDFKLE